MRDYERIPAPLLADGDLTLQARAVYGILRHLIWNETHEVGDTVSAELPEMKELAASVGCSKTALNDYLKELRRAGWLATTRKARGKPQIYTLFSVARRPDSEPRVDRNPNHSRERGSLLSDEVPDAEVEPGGSTSVGRARNIVFDAIAEATGENVAIAGGKIAKAEKAIRAAEADTIEEQVQAALALQPELDEIPKHRIDAWLAEKVKRRAQRYRECRDWELTATALASHWLRIPTWEPRQDSRGGLTPSELANLDLG